MNEGIVQSLKNAEYDLRIVNQNKWMVWNKLDKQWEVYNSYNGKIGRLVISTKDEGEAVYHLVTD